MASREYIVGRRGISKVTFGLQSEEKRFRADRIMYALFFIKTSITTPETSSEGLIFKKFPGEPPIGVLDYICISNMHV